MLRALRSIYVADTTPTATIEFHHARRGHQRRQHDDVAKAFIYDCTNLTLWYIDVTYDDEEFINFLLKWDHCMPINIYVYFGGYDMSHMFKNVKLSTIEKVVGTVHLIVAPRKSRIKRRKRKPPIVTDIVM